MTLLSGFFLKHVALTDTCLKGLDIVFFQKKDARVVESELRSLFDFFKNSVHVSRLDVDASAIINILDVHEITKFPKNERFLLYLNTIRDYFYYLSGLTKEISTNKVMLSIVKSRPRRNLKPSSVTVISETTSVQSKFSKISS